MRPSRPFGGSGGVRSVALFGSTTHRRSMSCSPKSRVTSDMRLPDQATVRGGRANASRRPSPESTRPESDQNLTTHHLSPEWGLLRTNRLLERYGRGRYWARTSDPQLVETEQRSRRIAHVRPQRMVEPDLWASEHVSERERTMSVAIVARRLRLTWRVRGSGSAWLEDPLRALFGADVALDSSCVALSGLRRGESLAGEVLPGVWRCAGGGRAGGARDAHGRPRSDLGHRRLLRR